MELGGSVMKGSYEKYLGLPPVVGKSKYNTFRGIKERVWKKIGNWKNSFLSSAGKEVLIKAVLQAIPTYTMSVFKLPKNLCKELNSLMAKFWWGNQSKSSSIHWCSWKKLSVSKERGGMGFRDLESFNVALLAKQGWRFLQNPGSLVAKIFKEKYFSKVTLLDAKLGYRPSFIWRSVWGVLRLLKEGLRWRVGNGRSIKIWGQKWLQTPSSFCVQSPCLILNEEATVSELISEGKWDVQLIERIFNQEEVDQICRIPISKLNSDDKMIWGGTKRGFFSVSSAYQMAMHRKVAVQGEYSKSREEDTRWKDFWGLNIPGKVKIFMWRATKELLATRQNLSLRKIVDCSKCPICKNDGESVMHALWFCPAAVDVWSESTNVIQKWNSHEYDLLDLWSRLVEKVSKEVLEEIAMVMRNIWSRRNEFIFEGVFKSPSQVIKAARDELRLFRMAHQIASINPARVDRGVVRWCRPRESFVKANWDAAVSKKDRKVGLGVVIRDEVGEILVAVREQKNFLTDPATAESLALWKAMEVCRDLNLNRVIFEGDAEVIVKAVNAGDEDFSSYGRIVEDAKKMLRVLENWSVNFVYSEANEAAHVLAKEALLIHSEIVWMEEIPSCIRGIISKERSCNDVIVQ